MRGKRDKFTKLLCLISYGKIFNSEYLLKSVNGIFFTIAPTLVIRIGHVGSQPGIRWLNLKNYHLNPLIFSNLSSIIYLINHQQFIPFF